MGGVRVVQLLDCDPALGDGLSAGDRAAAGAALPLRATALEKGQWQPDREPPGAEHLGFLLVRGLIARRVEVGGGASVELLGRGDLLQPWLEDTTSFCEASWEVLERTTLAVLGPRLVCDLGRWPVVSANLVARGMRRSRASAADSAIASIVGLDERLLVLLWRIAERWGKAKPDGVHVSIRLPHRVLAELAGARRPSVTTALAELREAGRLDRTAGGRWVLLGDPPG